MSDRYKRKVRQRNYLERKRQSSRCLTRKNRLREFLELYPDYQQKIHFLTEEEIEILSNYYFLGMPLKKIADKLNLSAEGVRNKRDKAIEKIAFMS